MTVTQGDSYFAYHQYLHRSHGVGQAAPRTSAVASALTPPLHATAKPSNHVYHLVTPSELPAASTNKISMAKPSTTDTIFFFDEELIRQAETASYRSPTCQPSSSQISRQGISEPRRPNATRTEPEQPTKKRR